MSPATAPRATPGPRAAPPSISAPAPPRSRASSSPIGAAPRAATGGSRPSSCNTGGPQPLPLPEASARPTTKHGRNFPTPTSRAARRGAAATDAAFSAASVARRQRARLRAASPPRTPSPWAGRSSSGPAAIGEAFASGPNDVVSWVPRFSDVAASGDLGFTVGDASSTSKASATFYTKYLTVWRKQKERRVAVRGGLRQQPAGARSPGAR